MVNMIKMTRKEIEKGLEDGSIAAGNTIDELMGISKRKNTRLQVDEYEDKHLGDEDTEE